MGTAIKHPMPGRVKPSFVIFDIRALWRSVQLITYLQLLMKCDISADCCRLVHTAEGGRLACDDNFHLSLSCLFLSIVSVWTWGTATCLHTIMSRWVPLNCGATTRIHKSGISPIAGLVSILKTAAIRNQNYHFLGIFWQFLCN